MSALPGLRPVIVLRPEPGNQATVDSARALGLNPIALPLTRIVPVNWDAPDPGEFDAILLSSSNTLRHGGAALARYRTLPALVVGAQTQQAAQQAGFTVKLTASEGINALLADPALSSYPRLLRLMGEDHIMLTDMAARAPQQLCERIVYRSEALAIAPEQLAALDQPCVVLAHAARALSDLAALLTRHRLNTCQIRVAAMSPRIAQAAGNGWETLSAAPTPTDAALLALAADLCRQ